MVVSDLPTLTTSADRYRPRQAVRLRANGIPAVSSDPAIAGIARSWSGRSNTSPSSVIMTNRSNVARNLRSWLTAMTVAS